MSRLPRPRIPLDVRLQVAERQLGHIWSIIGQSRSERLTLMLKKMFGDEPVHLDHDPSLAAREKIKRNGDVVGYRPHANDPAYLVYRTKVDHGIKTYVRGERGQYSDVVLIKRERKRERKASQKMEKEMAEKKLSKRA